KNPDLVEPLQDPKRSLVRFAKALQRTKGKSAGAITRVTHFGDSLIDLDHISSELRHHYQKRYGDGGHGFTLGAKPWTWYNQYGLVHANGKSWTSYRVVGGTRIDYRLGLGGSAVEQKSGGGWLRIRATNALSFSKLELWTMRQAGGGNIAVKIDSARVGSVSTGGAPRAPMFSSFKFADATHTISLRASGHVRVLGAVIERAGPGVVWDNLPMVSVRFHQLAKIDKRFFVEQLKHRNSDLVVFQYGANDTLSFGKSLEQYGQRIGVVLDRVREAIPDVSCIVIGPLDRLVRGKKGLHSPYVVRKVSDKQREIAFSKGCAFWDGQRGMGGRGSMKWFLKRGLALKDMVHLQPKGGAIVAKRFAAAIDAALTKY
ncbi:MAG: hypothetical protein KC503_36665, partial [Myxococcales bacterium]|nr:hypothetical protein [Myxococcales bacterium]